MEFYDNTIVSTYRNCSRKGYFSHVRHWRPEGGMGLAPGFGIAFHSAMDVMWRGFCVPNAIAEETAFEVLKNSATAFEESWAEEKLPTADAFDEGREYDLYGPSNAASILYEYALERRSRLSRMQLLEVERPFVVPIYPDRTDVMYCGRLDKVVRMYEDGKIWIIDHKTTSQYLKAGGFREAFLESFSPDTQIEGYQYAGNMLYGKDFGGVMIDAILVHKEVRKFKLIPILLDPSRLDAWLWETRRNIESFQYDKAHLNDEGSFLASFPRNPSRCWDYNSPCPFMDPCRSWAHPHREPMPMGYVEEVWSPFEKNQLERLGLKENK